MTILKLREFSEKSFFSLCMCVCSLAPPPGQKDLCRLKVWVSFPPVKILVPYLMFTLRYDITHGNSKIFLIVCLRDIIKEKSIVKKLIKI